MSAPTTTGAPLPALTAEHLGEGLVLLPGSDSVELKATVPGADRRRVVQRLGLDPLAAELRQVASFDTPDLGLNGHGVVVRARRIQGKAGDTVIKLRPINPADLSEDLRGDRAFGVEVDAMPGGYLCSTSMKGTAKDKKLRGVFRGEAPARALFSAPQRALFDAYVPAGVTWEDLRVLGPLTLLRLKFAPEGFPRRMVAELWMYPDGSQILELSAKCLPAEAFTAAAEAKAFLASRGVDLGAPQQTKTSTALAYFAALDE